MSPYDVRLIPEHVHMVNPKSLAYTYKTLPLLDFNPNPVAITL